MLAVETLQLQFIQFPQPRLFWQAHFRCLLRRALLRLFSGREGAGGGAERRQLPGGERRHRGGHGLLPPQEGDDLGYKVFPRYNHIRWKRRVYPAVCFSCLGKVECPKGRLALCVLRASTIPCGCTRTGPACLVNSLQWWKPNQYQLNLPCNNLGVSSLQNQGSTWLWLPTITLWIFTTSSPARGLAFAKVPPATSPTSTGTPEVKCWPEIQSGNAHKME